jgi:regulatory protein
MEREDRSEEAGSDESSWESESGGVVTGIVESAKKDGRFVVQVDGKAFATVSLDLLEQYRLAIGATVRGSLRTALVDAAAALATYDRALNMLAFQPRSSRDLRRRLIQKGEPEAWVDAAIVRLEARGLLDDAQFARQFTRSRVLGAGASKRRLQQELFKRGVSRETADAAIGEVLVDEEVDEGAVVERAAAKKLRSLGKLDPATRRRRLYAFLARKGFDGQAIREAMAKVLDGAEAEAADDELLGAEE